MNKKHADLAITLSFEFHKYLMSHSAVARRIPRDATVVFQLPGRSAFNRWSRDLGLVQERRGGRVITVCVRSMGPPVSRIREVSLAV